MQCEWNKSLLKQFVCAEIEHRSESAMSLRTVESWEMGFSFQDVGAEVGGIVACITNFHNYIIV